MVLVISSEFSSTQPKAVVLSFPFGKVVQVQPCWKTEQVLPQSSGAQLPAPLYSSTTQPHLACCPLGWMKNPKENTCDHLLLLRDPTIQQSQKKPSPEDEPQALSESRAQHGKGKYPQLFLTKEGSARRAPSPSAALHIPLGQGCSCWDLAQPNPVPGHNPGSSPRAWPVPGSLSPSSWGHCQPQTSVPAPHQENIPPSSLQQERTQLPARTRTQKK